MLAYFKFGHMNKKHEGLIGLLLSLHVLLLYNLHLGARLLYVVGQSWLLLSNKHT